MFIHRDLKTANLLVDANYNVKVCDFGLSVRYHRSMPLPQLYVPKCWHLCSHHHQQIKQRGENLKDGQEGAKGTPLWMAPEVMMGQPFNEKADIYRYEGRFTLT